MAETRADPFSAFYQTIQSHVRSKGLANIAIAVIVCDTVFRCLSAIHLLSYWSIIAFDLAALKMMGYVAGIVANVAILKRKRWCVLLGIAAVAVGLWLFALDLWSLFHAAFGPGLIAFNRFFVVRNLTKQIFRGAWLIIYMLALVILLGELKERHSLHRDAL